MLKVLVLVALSSVSVLADQKIRQIVGDGSLLIGVNSENYAIAAPELKQLNWASISVDGKQISIVTLDCQIILRDTDSLGEDEKKQLDSAVSQRLQVSDQIGVNLFEDGCQYWFQQLDWGNLNIFNNVVSNNGRTIRQMGDGHWSMSDQNGLSDNVERIFVDDDLVTFIYLNGSVRMDPKVCLNADKKQLVDSIGFNQQRIITDEEIQTSQVELQERLAEQRERREDQLRDRLAKQQQLQDRLARQQQQLQERLAKQQERLAKQQQQLQDRLAKQQQQLQERLAKQQERLAKQQQQLQERLSSRLGRF